MNGPEFDDANPELSHGKTGFWPQMKLFGIPPGPFARAT